MIRLLGFACGLMLVLSSGFAEASESVTSVVISSPDTARASVGGLLEMLRDKDGLTRSAAARELANRKVVSAVSPLKAALADPLSYVRVSAAAALLDLGDRSGVGVLREAVKSDKVMGVGAARDLLEHGDDTGLSLVQGELKNPIAALRSLAIHALSRSKNEEIAFGALKLGLEDEDPMTRGSAIYWIGELGSQRSIALLTSVYGSFEDAERREKVMYAAVTTKLWDAVPLLISGLDDPAVKVRRTAAGGLVKLTAKAIPGNVDDPAEAKAVAQQWQEWWAANKAHCSMGQKSKSPLLEEQGVKIRL